MVREIDPNVQLDEEVEDTLFAIADDFIDNVIQGACRMAKHRHVNTIEVKDVQLYLGIFYLTTFRFHFFLIEKWLRLKFTLKVRIHG